MSDIPKQTVTIDLPTFIDILTRCTKAETLLEEKQKDVDRLYIENLRLREQVQLMEAKA